MKYTDVFCYTSRMKFRAYIISLIGIGFFGFAFSVSASFSDISVRHPHADAVLYVQKHGIVRGYEDGTFRPEQSINRAEFTKIIMEATQDLPSEACVNASALFPDVPTNAWFAPYVCRAKSAGVIAGYPDGTFRPQQTISFVEAAKIVVSALNLQHEETSVWYEGYVRALADMHAISHDIVSFEHPLTRGQMAEITYRLLADIPPKNSLTFEQLSQPVAMLHSTDAADGNTRAIATFAGGCFWCMDPPYQEHEGVYDAIVGYAGGTAETAQYSQVVRGTTVHRESVQVTYNPTVVSYSELLDIFWRQINPTDSGGQFADRGLQYTTAIFTHTENQKQLAEAAKKALDDSGKFDAPVVTDILPYSTFFPAEEYHQDYYKKSSDHYERYKKGSGREGFIEENWARTAALEYADAQKISSYALTDEERESLREQLDSESYDIIAEEGTERPFINEFWDTKDAGIYVDKISGEPLYASVHKYDSGTGWPSFWRAIDDQFIVRKKDRKLFTTRTELRSRFGDSHLGHLFSDGPTDKTGLRHCINSAALRFVPKDDMAAQGYGRYLELFTQE